MSALRFAGAAIPTHLRGVGTDTTADLAALHLWLPPVQGAGGELRGGWHEIAAYLTSPGETPDAQRIASDMMDNAVAWLRTSGRARDVLVAALVGLGVDLAGVPSYAWQGRTSSPPEAAQPHPHHLLTADGLEPMWAELRRACWGPIEQQRLAGVPDVPTIGDHQGPRARRLAEQRGSGTP